MAVFLDSSHPKHQLGFLGSLYPRNIYLSEGYSRSISFQVYRDWSMVAKSIPPCKEAGSGGTGMTPGITNPESLETFCSLCSQTIQACFFLIDVLWPLEIPFSIHSSLFYIHQPKHSKWQQLAYQQISKSFALESLICRE